MLNNKIYNSIDKSLSKKLILALLGISVFSIIIITLTIYFMMKMNVSFILSDDLKSKNNIIYDMINTGYEDFESELTNIAENGTRITKSLVASNNPNAKKVAEEVLLSQKIGKNGYIYAINSQGVIQFHPKKELIGNNLIKHQFIKDSIKNKSGTIEYKWANPGEKAPRSKIIGLSYYEPFDWIISASAYTEDFTHKSFSLKSPIKEKIKSIKVGDTGSIFIINSSGDILLHKDQEGKNISNLDYIKDIIKKKNGTTEYKHNKENNIAVFRYFEPLDWYIVTGGNYTDIIDSAMKSVRLTIFVIIIFFIILISILVTLTLNKLIIKPVKQAEIMTNQLKNGDLTISTEFKTNDEIGVLIQSVGEIINSFKEIFISLKLNIYELSESSTKMSSVSKNLAEMSQDQASSVEESSAALQETIDSMDKIAETASTVYQNVDKNASKMSDMASEAKSSFTEATEVSNLMIKTASDASQGQQDLNDMVVEMQKIKNSTSKIAEIISIISDISDQVNLLSLNAAIEAARAGEHGRGFAVVADEISKLADQTSESAKTITSLVNDGNKQVDLGTKIVDRTASTFRIIIQNIELVKNSMSKFSETLKRLADMASDARGRTDNIKKLANEISNATNEQKTSTREVSSTVDKINESSQQLASFAETISQSSEEINTISIELSNFIAKFKVK